MSTGIIEGFRLSPQQRHLWAVSEGGTRWWSRASCALLLEGELDVELLRRAVGRLVAQHEILRTTFHRRPGLRVPIQVVAGDADGSWRMEAPDEPGGDPVETVQELARQDAALPSDFENGPLFRLRLSTLHSASHVLFFSLPALCADRGSLYNIAWQLASLYDVEMAEGHADGAIQYVDFSEWQNELLEAGDEPAQNARAHWRSTPALTRNVPFEKLDGATGFPARSEFHLDPELLARIEAFCRGEGFLTADFLLACWQTLLWRTTSKAEVLVREVQDGRKLEELKDALGLFGTAVPIVSAFEGNPLFSEIVRSSGEARQRNAQWQEYFGRKEDFDPLSGGGADSPGFEFAERPGLPVARNLSLSILQEFSCVDAFPVWLSCVREGNRVRLSCLADSDILPGDAAARIAGHLEPLIAAAARDPQARAGELPILLPSERRRLLVELNRTSTEVPDSHCVHELFERQAERTPESPAVVFGPQQLTYAELNRRANALAFRLRGHAIGPDFRVGLSLDRSAEMIVAVLAILKAGGAFVPLNPDHPSARLSLQLAQSNARLVISNSRWLRKFADFAGEKICLDQRSQLLGVGGREETRNPKGLSRPESLAYIMYTSGSTGVPKGVAVRHDSLVHYAKFVVRHLLGLDPVAGVSLTFATVSTISADLGNTAIFPSLISGGCLHVVDSETAMEGSRFAEYLAHNPLDVLKIVPSHLDALLSSGGGRSILPRRSLILGGESLSWELVDRIDRLGGSCEIVNEYGPTEATVGSLVYRVAPGARRPSSRTVPIGRPITNTEVFVLDGANEPVPVGVPGELYIGGVGLAEGYCNEPVETAARFVRHPFSESRDARLYRTGDLVRYLLDGNVEFLGRVDDQIKIRGFRIEPGEVQAALAAHPAVAESVVMAREDTPGARRLVAYIVPARGAAVSIEEVLGWVQKRLPDYMVPSALVILREFPLTANGKVDRRALPSPEQTPSERPYVAPRTLAERTVAQIWADVLRVERVSVEDNVFQIGVNSLLVTQVVRRMRKELQREVPIRWLFEAPTVAQLAARVEEAAQEEISIILDELEGLPEKE